MFVLGNVIFLFCDMCLTKPSQTTQAKSAKPNQTTPNMLKAFGLLDAETFWGSRHCNPKPNTKHQSEPKGDQDDPKSYILETLVERPKEFEKNVIFRLGLITKLGLGTM